MTFRQRSWLRGFRQFQISVMSELLIGVSSVEQLMLWSAVRHAKVSPSAESDKDFLIREVSSCSSLSELCEKLGLDTYYGRMFVGACPKTEGEPLAPSCGSWMNAGMLVDGEYVTLNLPEYPCETVTEELPDGSVRSHSAAGVSFLSQFLENPQDVPQRYVLSSTAASGILKRAAKRGKPLPPLLEKALRKQAGMED